MNLTFCCPFCQESARLDVELTDKKMVCPHCSKDIQFPANAIQKEKIQKCITCPSTDLFVRKDFPMKLGVGLVVAGIVGSSIAWAYYMPIWSFVILAASAVIDVLLYQIVGNALVCYRCEAHYRFLPGLEQYAPFDLEIHERYRQEAARLNDAEPDKIASDQTAE